MELSVGLFVLEDFPLGQPGVSTDKCLMRAAVCHTEYDAVVQGAADKASDEMVK